MSMPAHVDDRFTLHHGDALEVLRELGDSSVDAVVTDPPYALDFMGNAWDSFAPRAFGQWCEVWATECLRVLKPGGHLLAFGGSRTWHRLASAVEDSGFEVRDSIAWLYGSGFPKSLDVAKAVDRLDAAEERLARAREFQAWLAPLLTAQQVNAATGTDMGHHLTTHPTQPSVATADLFDLLRPLLPEVPEHVEQLVAQRTVESANYAQRPAAEYDGRPGMAESWDDGTGTGWNGAAARGGAAVTPEAAQWEGWGTALKPSFEPIVVARKPFPGTVAANVVEHGTGALNIAGTRLEPRGVEQSQGSYAGSDVPVAGTADRSATYAADLGRWPANVVLDSSQADELDEQVGQLTSGANPTRRGSDKFREAYGDFAGQAEITPARGVDSGGASRFYLRADWSPADLDDMVRFHYCAKAGSAERVKLPSAGAGAELFASSIRKRCTKCGKQQVNMGTSACSCAAPDFQPDPSMSGHVSHPTVKPLALMRWLVRLVTPTDGIVLDPFTGSGTTVEACLLEGMRCIAIEREGKYLPLILQRRARRHDPVAAVKAAGDDLGLFGLLGGDS